MGNAVLTNAVATSVWSTWASTNFDSNPRQGSRTGGLGDAFSLMYFPRAFPLGAAIISAKVKFYSTSMTTGTHTLNFQRVSVPWSASKVTWNSRPTTFIAGVKAVTKTGVLADKVEWELDITDWMQTLADGGVNHGWKSQVTESTARYFYSEVAPETAYRPRLEISWSDAPSTPIGLAPSGGRAVGLNKPVLRAVYIDVSGSTSLQAVQVQINATDSWGAPTFDSGTVLTSVPELDLATTAYGGLADGVTTFWRIRLQDAAGLWSPWSSAVSFKRDDRGGLTITNPPSGTPTVEDATPPIIWTFAGETQAAYQIQITHLENTARVVDWDSGKVTSTATSVTVPAGRINEPSSTTYTVTVRVWDNKQREATPGSTVYSQLVRDFTFVPGATTGTTGLAVVAGDPRPTVTLTWQRISSPDSFSILRNGKVISSGILPEDVFVSGTTYTWVDHSPSPGRPLTYSVQAVVNAVASATNASATVTVRSSGIWLRDPSAGLEVCLIGNSDREFTLGESAAVLQSIAPSANKVAINQSLGGLEGHVEGELHSMYGKTAQEWRDQYLKMRALRVKKFWLTVGDYTFLAVCQEFTYTQRGTAENVFRVSFMAYQQDLVTSAYLGAGGTWSGGFTGGFN